jgi:nitric oxide reductase subunit C
VAGKRVWQKYNCNDCHTILGFVGYYAPDMTKVYTRVGRMGIEERLKKRDVERERRDREVSRLKDVIAEITAENLELKKTLSG